MTCGSDDRDKHPGRGSPSTSLEGDEPEVAWNRPIPVVLRVEQGDGAGHTLLLSAQLLPMNKLKILLGAWQVLTVFSSITGVQFPASYSVLLSWIKVLNFDLGYILSASCILPSVNFYHSVLATTIGLLGVAAGLVLTYRVAKDRAGTGAAGLIATNDAWSRHVAAGLLTTFLVSAIGFGASLWQRNPPGRVMPIGRKNIESRPDSEPESTMYVCGVRISRMSSWARGGSFVEPEMNPWKQIAKGTITLTVRQFSCVAYYRWLGYTGSIIDKPLDVRHAVVHPPCVCFIANVTGYRGSYLTHIVK